MSQVNAAEAAPESKEADKAPEKSEATTTTDALKEAPKVEDGKPAAEAEGDKPKAEETKTEEKPEVKKSLATDGAELPKVEKSEGDKPGKEKPEPVTLKLAEDSQLGDDVVKSIKTFVDDHGLSQKQANALLARQESAVVAHEAALEAQDDAWTREAFEDKELGGTEENFKQTAVYSQRALKVYGSEKLIGQLRETRQGNNPEIVRMLAKIGKAMGESGSLVTGQNVTGTKKSDTELFYPNSMNKKE